MKHEQHYLNSQLEDEVIAIVQGIDRDVERGEDILMFGFCTVMLSSTFAPLAPPSVILPMVALVFALSVTFARRNYHNMERKLAFSIAQLQSHQQLMLRPISTVFVERPMPPLSVSFNPIKNWRRTWKSVLGGLLINPLWMPIFYMMGMQIIEEKNLIVLNQAIIGVEQKISP